jgi:hypothetical protein
VATAQNAGGNADTSSNQVWPREQAASARPGDYLYPDPAPSGGSYERRPDGGWDFVPFDGDRRIPLEQVDDAESAHEPPPRESVAGASGVPAGWNVGVSATGGETVDVDGDVIGGYGGYGGSARGAERSDRADGGSGGSGGSGGTNIGVVQSGSGKVNVGGAVTGQQVTYNSGGPAASTPASNAGSQAAADDCDGM